MVVARPVAVRHHPLIKWGRSWILRNLRWSERSRSSGMAKAVLALPAHASRPGPGSGRRQLLRG